MIHLHNRSCYSLLSGVMKPEQIAKKAAASGQKQAVLTDWNAMYAWMDFVHACQKENIQPIAGLEFELETEGRIHPLFLLAQNTAGLQNLFVLSTILNTKHRRIGLEDLQAHSDGCLTFFGLADEQICQWSEQNNLQAMTDFTAALKQNSSRLVFAHGFNDSVRWKNSNEKVRPIAEELQIEQAAVSGIYYENASDWQTLQLMQAIACQKPLWDSTLKIRRERHWRSEEEMKILYDQDLLDKTDELAASVEEYSLPKASLPVVPNRANEPSDVFLRHLAAAGLSRRLGGQVDARYARRLEYELDVITSMGFADYFLVVWDFIRESRQRNILAGPGRGSAAGSLTAWAIGITHVDPLANGLLFERFLNPARISMPDIDTDFPDDRRDEILEYVQEKYGKGHAAHIAAFATFKPRLAIKDAARAMGISNADASALAKLVPSVPGATLENTMKTVPQFAFKVQNSHQMSRLYEAARSLEGLPRHLTVHAGGIVLTRDPIVWQAPLQDVDAPLPCVQFAMHNLEELGLIKLDFLAIRNLTTLAAMLDDAQRQLGRKIDLFKLPLDDPKVYRLLSSGHTLGIFQLESAGIRELMVKMQPTCFDDIAAVLALYRPGPMKNIDSYLKSRKNPALRMRLHPLLDDLLKDTGGIFLYQEQIMEAARRIGGLSLAQADVLRKAMSKKQHDVMDSWKSVFIEGAAKNNISEKDASGIFDIMARFADYGFNKSHSYAYGMVVYEMAWMKVHFPLSFFVRSLNATMADSAKSSAYLQEARNMGICVKGIDINASAGSWTLEEGALRAGFGLIHGFSRLTSEKIAAEKEKRGPFVGLNNTIYRLLQGGVDEKSIISLCRTGAFDSLAVGYSRAAIEAGVKGAMQYSNLVVWDEQSNSFRMTAMSEMPLQKIPEDPASVLNMEYELLGLYLSSHPSAALRRKDRSIVSLKQAAGAGGYMKVSGIASRVKEHKTKTGQIMAFVSLQDDTASLDLAVMPALYQRHKDLLQAKKLIVVQGKKNRPDSMLADEIWYV